MERSEQYKNKWLLEIAERNGFDTIEEYDAYVKKAEVIREVKELKTSYKASKIDINEVTLALIELAKKSGLFFTDLYTAFFSRNPGAHI
ncbi:MAG TPA: hypothetical protein VEA37_03385 [Flavobacterium sp.]|nr:hypothetical protein [Flavobacterium sp.]